MLMYGLVGSGSFRDTNLEIIPRGFYKALLPLSLDRIAGLSTPANRTRATPGRSPGDET